MKILPMGGNLVCIEFENGDKITVSDSCHKDIAHTINTIKKGKSPFQTGGAIEHTYKLKNSLIYGED